MQVVFTGGPRAWNLVVCLSAVNFVKISTKENSVLLCFVFILLTILQNFNINEYKKIFIWMNLYKAYIYNAYIHNWVQTSIIYFRKAELTVKYRDEFARLVFF